MKKTARSRGSTGGTQKSAFNLKVENKITAAGTGFAEK